MNLQRFALISEIVSGIAIVVTLIVLIFEVRANTETIQTQTVFTVYAVEREQNARLIENLGGIADIRIKVEEGDDLTRVEEYRYRLFLRDQLNNWEWQFGAAFQFGRLPAQVLDPEAWADIWLVSPGISEEYERTRESRNPDWLEFMERNVISPEVVQ